MVTDDGLNALYMTGFDATKLGTDTMRVSFDGVYNPPVEMEVGAVSGVQTGMISYFYDEDDVVITYSDTGLDYVEADNPSYYFSEEVTSGIEFSFGSTVNGDSGTIVVDIASLPHKLVVGSVMTVVLPAYNQNYVGLGVSVGTPMMSGSDPPSIASATSSSVSMGTPTLEYVSSTSLKVTFHNTEEVPAGDTF
jgi:hypothetical protein